MDNKHNIPRDSGYHPETFRNRDMTFHPGPICAYQLADRYLKMTGRVFLTGTQALVRIALDQARRDRAAGLKTGGFISGYRGSPLGVVDRELWRTSDELEKWGIEFLPAVNEDLAATAVLGTQAVETNPQARVDGVFAMWYGKGPGVDRSGDALKHGNAYGSSPRGGVLVVAGDDHGCVSSSMSHQSDAAFLSWFMPTLNPANVAEYLSFGAYGYALSRFSGSWVGFKAISETVESAASVELPPEPSFCIPEFEMPPDGLHYRWPDLPGPQIEERLEAKKHAMFAFAEANPIDRKIYDIKDARYGIVTTGKGHLDAMEALRLLGIDERACRRLGIDIYKVGMVWPLARQDALGFVRGKQEVLVVEEKRGIIESQLKEYFYDWPGHKPERMVGKNDETLHRLVPWTGELSPLQLVPILAKRLAGIFREEGFEERAEKLTRQQPIVLALDGASRTPYFCSGCPHNTSTRVPEGSQALAGIGCHAMVTWMDRNTTSLTQMGGEGVNWAASSRFTGNGHVFQNLGEGTWHHSGSMAIRQAIASGANITYKILYNDAVAMTGGQPVSGPVSVQAIAQICRAEGVERIALVSDDPAKFRASDFPPNATIHHRHQLDPLQRELRKVKGVSVLIYEQACATEKRRRRKAGTLDDPKTFAVINELVCEGCGDCSVASNCLSVEPVETPFGRKRKINLSTCNKDFSCVEGFCPSFVIVQNAVRRKRTGSAPDVAALMSDLALPEMTPLTGAYDLLVTGVGGTGVVTVGALITMAAHLEGKGSSVLDFTGFAQKFGTVLSFIRLAPHPAGLNQARIETGAADAVIGCDIVVSSSPKASVCYRKGSKMVLNRAEMPTGDIVRDRDASLRVDEREKAIAEAVGDQNLSALDANAISDELLGDTIFANVLMLGFAWQKGLVPVSLQAISQAIRLNGVAVERNLAAFTFGRALASDPDWLANLQRRNDGQAEAFGNLVAERAAFLECYQDRRYAERYRTTLAEFHGGLPDHLADEFGALAARSLFKLMAYKDEYEVARLHLDQSFAAKLQEEFEPGYSIHHHFAPPLLSFGKDARGRPRKLRLGPWVRPGLKVLTRLKVLRGTPFDPFGYTAERKREREQAGWYEQLLQTCGTELDPETENSWRQILEVPMALRGYGPIKMAAIEKALDTVSRLRRQPAYSP